VQNLVPEDQPLTYYKLTTEELARTSDPVAIPGTLWNVVSLSNETLHSDAYWSIFKQTMIILLGFMFVGFIMRNLIIE